MRPRHRATRPVAKIEPLEGRTLLAVDVGIDPAMTFQTIDGFGSALAWWVTSPYDTTAWREMYWQDLGASMLRMDMNMTALRAGDGNYATPVVLGPDLQDNIDLFDFGAIGVANFGGVAQAGETLAHDDTKIIGTLWTPPHWMKGAEVDPLTGNFVDTDPGTPGTQFKMPTLDGHDSLGGSLIDTEENLTQFARYVAAWVKGFEQAYGTPMYAVSIQNELVFSQPYRSAVYSPGLYVKALIAVGEEFGRLGIDTKLFGPEDVAGGDPIDNPWLLWRNFNFINAVRYDDEAAPYMDIWATHGYQGDGVTAGGTSNGALNWQLFREGRSMEDYPEPPGAWWEGVGYDADVWMTETSGEHPSWLHTNAAGGQDGAFSLARNIHEALAYGNVSAWVYWQTGDGGANDEFTLTSGTDTTAKKYNAAKHYFRYVRPGAVRVEATPSNISDVYVSAFRHEQDQTLTTVLINNTASSQTVNIDVGGLNVDAFDIARRTSGTDTWASIGPVSVTNGVATLTLPGQSVVTLQGAIEEDDPDPPPPDPDPEAGPAPVRVAYFNRTINDGDGTPALIDGTDFTSTAVSQTGRIRPFTITNNAGETITVSSITFTDGGGFTLYGAGPGTIAAGATETFFVQLDTASAGNKAATVNVNVSGFDPHTFAVRGAVVSGPTSRQHESMLLVHGRSAKDVVAVTRPAAGTIRATVNGVSLDYDAATLSRVEVFTYAGDDSVTLASGLPTYAFTDYGEDTILAGTGNDTVSGGGQRDVIFGTAGRNRLNGNGGHDYIIGGNADDRIYGGDGNDVIGGGAGVDRIWGHAGDDFLTGGGSNDKIRGGSGNDTLVGNGGDDLLDGESGTDTAANIEPGDTLISIEVPPQPEPLLSLASAHRGDGALRGLWATRPTSAGGDDDDDDDARVPLHLVTP